MQSNDERREQVRMILTLGLCGFNIHEAAEILDTGLGDITKALNDSSGRPFAGWRGNEFKCGKLARLKYGVSDHLPLVGSAATMSDARAAMNEIIAVPHVQ